LSIRYHRLKLWRAELCDANLGLAELDPPSTDAALVQQKSSPERFERRLRKEGSRRIYGVGDVAAVDSGVVEGDSVVEAGLVISVVVVVVVVGGLVAAGVAAGSVVSVFCSHATRSAAPARMQMYFFMIERHIALID